MPSVVVSFPSLSLMKLKKKRHMRKAGTDLLRSLGGSGGGVGGIVCVEVVVQSADKVGLETCQIQNWQRKGKQ
jgi:hypothetical protein